MVEFCGDARSRSASRSQSQVWCPAHAGALWQMSHVVLAVAGDYSLATRDSPYAFSTTVRTFSGGSMLECLSPSRQTPLGGCVKNLGVLSRSLLGIADVSAASASSGGALWNAQMLFPLITLAVGQVTTRDSRSIMPAGRWPSLSQTPTDWLAPVDACSAQKACSPLLTALRQNWRSSVGGEGCIAHANFRQAGLVTCEARRLACAMSGWTTGTNGLAHGTGGSAVEREASGHPEQSLQDVPKMSKVWRAGRRACPETDSGGSLPMAIRSPWEESVHLTPACGERVVSVW